MNLMKLTALMAGGPGSGCNPDVAQPRCGRPSGSGGSGHGYKSGDRLILTKSVKIKGLPGAKGLRKTFHPGAKVTFLHEVPGSHGGLVVKFKNGIQYHVTADQVQLQKRLEDIQPKKSFRERLKEAEKNRRIAPMMVKQGKSEYLKYLTPTQREAIRKEYLKPLTGKNVKYSEYMPQGYRYTEYTAKGPEVNEKADLKELRHGGRGRFHQASEVKNLDGNYSARYEMYNKEGAGTTLLMFRDLAKRTMLVKELNHDQYNYTGSLHEFTFRNLGRGAGFMKHRYGISIRPPRRR